MIEQIVWLVSIAFVIALFAGITAKLPIPSVRSRGDHADRADDPQGLVGPWPESRSGAQELPAVARLFALTSKSGAASTAYLAMGSEWGRPVRRRLIPVAAYMASVGCIAVVLIGLVAMMPTDPRQPVIAPYNAPGMDSPATAEATTHVVPRNQVAGGATNVEQDRKSVV